MKKVHTSFKYMGKKIFVPRKKNAKKGLLVGIGMRHSAGKIEVEV
jgi:hypothetical protein